MIFVNQEIVYSIEYGWHCFQNSIVDIDVMIHAANKNQQSPWRSTHFLRILSESIWLVFIHDNTAREFCNDGVTSSSVSIQPSSKYHWSMFDIKRVALPFVQASVSSSCATGLWYWALSSGLTPCLDTRCTSKPVLPLKIWGCVQPGKVHCFGTHRVLWKSRLWFTNDWWSLNIIVDSHPSNGQALDSKWTRSLW